MCLPAHTRARVCLTTHIHTHLHPSQHPPTHRHNSLKFGKYRNAAGSLVGPVPDIEELVAVGKAHGVCPFYLGRDAGGERGGLRRGGERLGEVEGACEMGGWRRRSPPCILPLTSPFP